MDMDVTGIMPDRAILITGGAGYIGSVISLLLSQLGYTVIVVDDLLYNQSIQHLKCATFIKGDFADEKIIKDICSYQNIHAIIHCAALNEDGASHSSPYKFYNNNVAKTVKLLGLMHQNGIKKFIFSSSGDVYGKPKDSPLPELHPKAPLSPYGHSKLMIEQILADAAQAYDLQYVALRFFNVAGALPEQGLGEQYSPENHLIPHIIRAAQQQKPFEIFGGDYPTKDGTYVRDYLHVLDVAQAHVSALMHLEQNKPSDVFNIGSGRGYSVKEVIETVEQVSQLPIKIIMKPRMQNEQAELIVDPSHAHSILGWQSKFSDLPYIIRSAYAFACSSSL